MTDAPQQSVSRQEFEAHRQQVTSNIEKLYDTLVSESEARQRGERAIRDDIQSLSNQQAQSGRPHFQAMTFYFGVFSFICFTVAGVYIWGQESRWTAAKEHRETIIEQLKGDLAAEARYEEATSIGRHREQQVQVDDAHRRVERLEEWALDHDHEVRGKNAAQDERLNAAERRLYHNAVPQRGD